MQRFEDQIRTLLAELEYRIGQPLKPTSPVLSWLVEYVAVLLNKYHINDATNLTAYEFMHGKQADEEKLAYFGERVFFSVPKRRRSNLDLRWSVGVFLGTMMSSTEALVGLPNGDVTRSASIARLIPSQKWSADTILNITGVPSQPTRSGYDDSILESFSNPHLMLDAEAKARIDGESPDDVDLPLCLHLGRKLPNVRITRGDLDKYSYTEGCPRCEHTKLGVVQHMNSNHWDACRRRVYTQMFVS